MTDKTRAFVTEKVKELCAAPTCCPELKTAGEAWLVAAGTPEESRATQALLMELDADVIKIDDLIAFMGSEAAANMLGAEKAAEILEQGKQAKAAGSKWCVCPACQAGSAIIEIRDELQ